MRHLITTIAAYHKRRAQEQREADEAILRFRDPQQYREVLLPLACVLVPVMVLCVLANLLRLWS